MLLYFKYEKAKSGRIYRKIRLRRYYYTRAYYYARLCSHTHTHTWINKRKKKKIERREEVFSVILSEVSGIEGQMVRQILI